jgi:long-subunit acyl-CoA synthetase (AMP-forming)
VIHISEDDAVNALSAGLTQQTLLLEDDSHDRLMAEQTIAKLLIVEKNQEKLMRSELENRKELQLLRESMQCAKAEKLELTLTAKLQQHATQSLFKHKCYELTF